MGGRLRVIQSAKGYRFSIDAILLAEFATVRPNDIVIDLGTGCGVILLILLATKETGKAFGLEIQADLASQALRNAELNGFADRMEVIRGDIRSLPFAGRSADVVIVNPPYRHTGSGRINQQPQRAIARHEILASLDDILAAAAALLRKKGRLALIYPAVRLTEILVRLRRRGLEPKRLQLNYPDLHSGAKLALIEAAQGGKPGLEICPPLLGQGNFSI